MIAEHRATEERYQQARTISRATAWEFLPVSLREAVSFRDIDVLAINLSRRWEEHPERRVLWDWRQIYSAYAFRHPKRFELAIWCSSLLCGLSIGKPTWGEGKLRLDLIEASPQKTPLSGKAVQLTILAAAAYGRHIGATELRIMHPINNTVRQHYISHGFIYLGGKSDYCVRGL